MLNENVSCFRGYHIAKVLSSCLEYNVSEVQVLVLCIMYDQSCLKGGLVLVERIISGS